MIPILLTDTAPPKSPPSQGGGLALSTDTSTDFASLLAEMDVEEVEDDPDFTLSVDVLMDMPAEVTNFLAVTGHNVQPNTDSDVNLTAKSIEYPEIAQTDTPDTFRQIDAVSDAVAEHTAPKANDVPRGPTWAQLIFERQVPQGPPGSSAAKVPEAIPNSMPPDVVSGDRLVQASDVNVVSPVEKTVAQVPNAVGLSNAVRPDEPVRKIHGDTPPKQPEMDVERPLPSPKTETAHVNTSVTQHRVVHQDVADVGRDDPELQRLFTLSDRPATISSHTPVAAVPASGTGTVRHVAQQMAVAVADRPGQPTEISLNPQELGRVRMTMSAVDASITMTIIAERPETSDLLRRNIETLTQEFRDLGYNDINFAFGRDSASEHQDSSRDKASFGEPVNAGGISELQGVEQTPATKSGMDIRV